MKASALTCFLVAGRHSTMRKIEMLDRYGLFEKSFASSTSVVFTYNEEQHHILNAIIFVPQFYYD